MNCLFHVGIVFINLEIKLESPSLEATLSQALILKWCISGKCRAMIALRGVKVERHAMILDHRLIAKVMLKDIEAVPLASMPSCQNRERILILKV